ncbi:MAG: PHP domain-containing protein [Micropruina sp.]
MSDPFVHLRVASGYSLRYGASQPAALVDAAVAAEMDTLALTDRDGLYGAVKFARACERTGVAPVIGVDHTMADGSRAVSLATSRRGWASLCRLTSAVHLAGERGRPRCTPEAMAGHDDLVVLLGDDSDLGRALATGSDDDAERVLRRWLDVVGRQRLAIAVTNQHAPGRGAGSAVLAGRMLAFADAHGLTGVLANAVRMTGKRLAPTLDVLDASRRLVPLGARSIDRRNAEGYLKTGKELLPAAEEAAALAGRRNAARLIGDTRTLATRCRLDPIADIGLDERHLPEFDVLGVRDSASDAITALRLRCEAGVAARYGVPTPEIENRLADELKVIDGFGYATYFLTVAEVVTMIGRLGIRCAARGSGAGSLVNYLLGLSGVDPIRYGLMMERFLSPLRKELPDIDIDVESSRRTEVYDAILDAFGGDRVACVAMMETYRVRHAIRDVGAALSLPPRETDAIAKAFPHIRASDARAALRDLPELRAAGLGERRLDVLFSLVESLDGLPRHVALHPCGVLLSDATLLDRTPVEASFGGFPMSQFDKDDVEGVENAQARRAGHPDAVGDGHALARSAGRGRRDRPGGAGALRRRGHLRHDRQVGHPGLLPDRIPGPARTGRQSSVPATSPTSSSTSRCSGRPGQIRHGGPVHSRCGTAGAIRAASRPGPALAETGGVVVFEQVIEIIAIMTDCTLAQADHARRALGRPIQPKVKDWFVPHGAGPGLPPRGGRPGLVRARVVRLVRLLQGARGVLRAAHLPVGLAEAALPAHFLAGVLTNPGALPQTADPGGGPALRHRDPRARRQPQRGRIPRSNGWSRRDRDPRGCASGSAADPAARAAHLQIALGSDDLPDAHPTCPGRPDPPLREPAPRPSGEPVAPGRRLTPGDGLPDGRGYGIRLSLADVKGITATEIARIAAGRPYHSS